MTGWPGVLGAICPFLDIDERIVDLIGLVNLTATPITDLKHPAKEGVVVGILEGAVNNSTGEEVARRMRERSQILIALGDCAVFGGVPTMRNSVGIQDALQRAYVETESTVDGAIPVHQDIAVMQDCRALDQVVPVDIYLPGCPALSRCHFLCANRVGGRSDASAQGQVSGLALGGAMGQKIVIEPVTRIEGHAKVAVYLDDMGKVEKAVFHVNEFRGFEKFCEGRMFFEMPQITERICGICPVSHHLASVKACDQIIGVDPPRPAHLLRELMHMGQIIQSHSMHVFELGGPDLLLGFDCDPATRNVVGSLSGQSPAHRKGDRAAQVRPVHHLPPGRAARAPQFRCSAEG